MREQIQAYFFQKLARYLQPSEYRRAARLKSHTGSQMSIPELLYLRSIIRRHVPEVIVEIGSSSGASTSAMAEQVRDLGRGFIYAIDLFSMSRPSPHLAPGYWRLFDTVMAPHQGLFEKIEADSTTLPWDRPIDLLFIDGDHSDAGVTKDLVKYTPFLRPGGHVLLHDYLDNPTTGSMAKSATDRLLGSHPEYERLGLVRSLIAFRKRALAPPSNHVEIRHAFDASL